MLTVAIPNKGALSEGSIDILRSAGYRCRRHGRELSMRDEEHNTEFVFLRPRDIAIYVGNGIIDIGITGRDLAVDSESDVRELLQLGFGKSRFFYAVPEESSLTPDQFGNLRIATSYPALVRSDMAKRGIVPKIIRLDGAVEISIKLGVADVIADVVESGRTLVEAGLKTIGEPILLSEAVVITRSDRPTDEPVTRLLKRLHGILLARGYAMVEYDVNRDQLDRACAITPGIEAPTISPLTRDNWVAVKSMIKQHEINRIMDELSDIGAKGILITDLRTCRL